MKHDWRFANYRIPSYNAYGVFFDCGSAGVGRAWTTPYLTNGSRHLAKVGTDDAAIDCAGGTMEFADSSEMPWTDGATLNLTGEIGKKSIRFGTDVNGLTAAQLASIRINGKKGCLDADGYLRGKSGMTLILR